MVILPIPDATPLAATLGMWLLNKVFRGSHFLSGKWGISVFANRFTVYHWPPSLYFVFTSGGVVAVKEPFYKVHMPCLGCMVCNIFVSHIVGPLWDFNRLVVFQKPTAHVWNRAYASILPPPPVPWGCLGAFVAFFHLPCVLPVSVPASTNVLWAFRHDMGCVPPSCGWRHLRLVFLCTPVILANQATVVWGASWGTRGALWSEQHHRHQSSFVHVWTLCRLHFRGLGTWSHLVSTLFLHVSFTPAHTCLSSASLRRWWQAMDVHFWWEVAHRRTV